jgi:hypothetical protein
MTAQVCTIGWKQADGYSEVPHFETSLQSNITNAMIQICINLINNFTLKNVVHVKCYSASEIWMCWTVCFPNLLASRFIYKYNMAFKSFGVASR